MVLDSTDDCFYRPKVYLRYYSFMVIQNNISSINRSYTFMTKQKPSSYLTNQRNGSTWLFNESLAI